MAWNRVYYVGKDGTPLESTNLADLLTVVRAGKDIRILFDYGSQQLILPAEAIWVEGSTLETNVVSALVKRPVRIAPHHEDDPIVFLPLDTPQIGEVTSKAIIQPTAKLGSEGFFPPEKVTMMWFAQE